MEEFPSGQRGQTVNLLRLASMVRIHLPPPLDGRIAQLGEHLPYKQGVTGSSPVVPTKSGPVVQLVRTLACHARGRRFEPVPGRHFCLCSSVGRAEDWKSSCRWFDSDRRHQQKVLELSFQAICECSSSGRAPPCQGGGSEFEPRHSLQKGRHDLWSCLPFWVPAALRPAPFGIPMLGRSKFALRRPAEQVPGAFAESMISVFHPVLKKERGKYSVFSFCQSNKLELLFSL